MDIAAINAILEKFPESKGNLMAVLHEVQDRFNYLDMPVDYEHLFSAGSMMGSGGMIVMDEDTCMVDVARYFLTFCREESCGQCPPCRDGIVQMVRLLNEITEGKGTPQHIQLLEELADMIRAVSLCGLGTSAPNPVLSTLRYFKDEYDAHILDRRCPAGVCRALTTFFIDETKCTGCTLCARNCPAAAIYGEKNSPHYIDQNKCVKCRVCYEGCKQEVKEGLVVETDTPRIVKYRQLILELLLGRSPDTPYLVELAAKHGVTASRFLTGESDDCVRCGRCILVCQEKIGAYALCFESRGPNRHVTTAFGRLSESCIGCGACAQVCPTGAIRVEDRGDKRKISMWGQVLASFKLERCTHCGRPFAPKKYLELINRKAYRPKGIELVNYICPECFKTGDRASEARKAGALRSAVVKWSVPRP